MTKIFMTLGPILSGDIGIWLGLYFLSAKAHIRRCKREGAAPDLRRVRNEYLVAFLLFHGFILGTMYLLWDWNGQN